jgi:Protein of unknown function (DUF998)
VRPVRASISVAGDGTAGQLGHFRVEVEHPPYALGEFEWLATIGTVAEGIGAIALAVALRRERAAALLLLVFGLMKLAMPLFPVDALGAPATSAGRVHNVLGSLTLPLSLGRAPAVRSAPAEGKPIRSRNRGGTGDCDGGGTGR